ncbi:hypothetical protein ACFX2G_032540 [Malus domestica]
MTLYVYCCIIFPEIKVCIPVFSVPKSSLNIFAFDFQERVNDTSAKPSHFAARPNVAPYAPPMITMDNDDGIPYKAIGGIAGELLEQNAQALNQISANLAAFQIQENVNLFCQTRDNILKIMNDLNDMTDVMKQMPPLPVKMNEELASHVGIPPHQMQS